MSPGNLARCAPVPPLLRVEPGDTVAALTSRIRADRCGSTLTWMYTPEEAAEMMLSAQRQRERLAARYP